MLTKLKRNRNRLTNVVLLCGGLGAIVLTDGFGVGKLLAVVIVVVPGVATLFLLDKFFFAEDDDHPGRWTLDADAEDG